jgi:hypothetical protein
MNPQGANNYSAVVQAFADLNINTSGNVSSLLSTAPTNAQQNQIKSAIVDVVSIDLEFNQHISSLSNISEFALIEELVGLHALYSSLCKSRIEIF